LKDIEDFDRLPMIINFGFSKAFLCF